MQRRVCDPLFAFFASPVSRCFLLAALALPLLGHRCAWEREAYPTLTALNFRRIFPSVREHLARSLADCVAADPFNDSFLRELTFILDEPRLLRVTAAVSRSSDARTAVIFRDEHRTVFMNEPSVMKSDDPKNVFLCLH